MALVLEQGPLEERRRGDDARLRARAEPQQLELRRDELRRLLRVRRRARAAAVNVRREVVDLLAVLVGDLRAARRARVRAEDDAAGINHAADGRARRHGRGHACRRAGGGGEPRVPRRQPEVEAAGLRGLLREHVLAAGGDAQLGHGWLVRRSCRSGVRVFIAAGVPYMGRRAAQQNPKFGSPRPRRAPRVPAPGRSARTGVLSGQDALLVAYRPVDL